MTHTLSENARAVLLPAFADTNLSDTVRRFLDRGGVSILLGETRAEYVGRAMDPARRAAETAGTFVTVTDEAKRRAGLLLAAVDQEMGGIARLHDLVPAFPARADLPGASPDRIEATARQIAKTAAGMGVNVFLAPILDVLDGQNAWLAGRTWSDDPRQVADLSAAYIRGVQSTGVAATGKHFPGFRSTTGDPAIDPDARCLTDLAAIEAGLPPFRAAIAAGVEMMMIGPAIVQALDPQVAALRSAKIIDKLTGEMGFDGITMADDLDGAATLRGDSVATVAIEALNAGCDYLLLADIGTQVEDIAEAIVSAASAGTLSEERLARSADRIRALARRYGTGQ